MKTTKKGFTLIELIVVIAIIGVLAAILVPSMLGYVKKSKIQGANSSATTFLNAFNSAGTDLDESDAWFQDGTYAFSDGKCTITAVEEGKEVKAEDVSDVIKPFFSDIAKIEANVKVTDGIGIACAVKSGKYFGTSPQAWTTKSYPTGDKAPKMSDALSAAVAKAENKKTTPPAGG